MDAEFAQGAGGDGADCGHSDAILQNAQLLAPREFHETVNGAGTEEKYGIRLSPRDASELFLIGIARTDCAIGSDFGDDQEKLAGVARSEEHTSELQSHLNLVCRLLLEKKKNSNMPGNYYQE